MRKLGFNFAAELDTRDIRFYRQGVGIVLNTAVNPYTLRKSVETVCYDQNRQHLTVVAAPGATEGSVSDEKAILYSIGFPDLLFLQPTMALAAYFGYKFVETMPVMSVVIGEEAADVSIILADKILYNGIIDVGFNSCARAVAAFVAEKFGKTISEKDAATIIDEIGSLLPKDTRHCKFPEFIIKAEQIRSVIYPFYEQIIGAINHVLSEASVDVIRQIKNSGVIFGGAGASMRGLTDAVYAVVGLQSLVADDPYNAALLGAGALLAEPKTLLKLTFDA